MTINDLKSQDLILFEIISGSRAYGLDTPDSDTDIKGVFYMPKNEFYGLNYIPQISNESNDIVYYEIGRFIDLLIKNNPNILEILSSPEDCILYRHSIMNRLNIDDFLSKLCKESFAGYALTQIRKAQGLNKKIVQPVSKNRKNILDFCYILENYNTCPLKEWLARESKNQEQCGLINIPHSKGLYALFYDDNQNLSYKGIMTSDLSNEVSLSSIPKGKQMLVYLYFNIDGYSAYCKEYKEYWAWVENRNPQRYADNISAMEQRHNFEKSYDTKNMMHTIRLLQVAEEILREGKLHVKRPNRDELLSIKRGEWSYKDLMRKAEDLKIKIEHAMPISKLPDMPNRAYLEKKLVEIRRELYS